MSKNKEQEEKMAQDLLAWEVMVESQNKRKLSDKLYPSDELVTMREGNNSEFLGNLSEKKKQNIKRNLITLKNIMLKNYQSVLNLILKKFYQCKIKSNKKLKL